MAAARQPCPVDGCDGTRRRGDLACLSCWYRVPRPLRDAVWHHWRASQQAPDPGARAAALRAWLATAREAQAAAAASLAASRERA